MIDESTQKLLHKLKQNAVNNKAIKSPSTVITPVQPSVSHPNFKNHPYQNLISKLPLLAQFAISSLEQTTNMPLEMSLPAVLGVMNFCCQHQVNADSILFGTIPTSLYLLTIAPPSSGKSTAMKALMDGVVKWIEKQKIRYSRDIVVHEGKLAQYEKEMREFKNGKLQHPPTRPIAPMTANFKAKVGTRNGLIETLKNQPCVGLVSSEGGEFFNGHAFQGGKNGVAQSTEMTVFLTDLFDSGSVEKNTAMDRDALGMEGRRMCISFMLQEAVIKDVLMNNRFSGAGFINRFMIARCDKFEKPEAQIETDQDIQKLSQLKTMLQPFHDRVFKLLNQKFNIKSDAGNCELQLPVLQMDQSARNLIQSFYNKYRNGGLFGEDVDQRWSDFENRLFELPLRLAATVAFFESKPEIDAVSMEAGIEIFKFYVDQRKTLLFAREIEKTVVVETSEAIAKYLKERASRDSNFKEISFNDMRRSVSKWIANNITAFDNNQRNDMLERLASDHGLIIEKKGKAIIIKL